MSIITVIQSVCSKSVREKKYDRNEDLSPRIFENGLIGEKILEKITMISLRKDVAAVGIRRHGQNESFND